VPVIYVAEPNIPHGPSVDLHGEAAHAVIRVEPQVGSDISLCSVQIIHGKAVHLGIKIRGCLNSSQQGGSIIRQPRP
jgi:hypothetical protein